MIHNLIDLVQVVATVFTLLVLIRVILSWFGPSLDHPLIGLVHRVTEPVMGPASRLLPPMGGFDFSPVLVLFGVQIVENIVVRILIGIAN